MVTMKYDKNRAIRNLNPDWKPFYVLENGDVVYPEADPKAPTEDQITAELTRLHNAEPVRLLRIERDKRLAKCDWRASSDLTIPDAWGTYRQQLRDLPASATPKLDSFYNLDKNSVTWPTEPS